jgi:hypothetical protein
VVWSVRVVVAFRWQDETSIGYAWGVRDIEARTCTACSGTERVVHAWVACLASFLAMGEPRGAGAAGACGGVPYLATTGLVYPLPASLGRVTGGGRRDMPFLFS